MERFGHRQQIAEITRERVRRTRQWYRLAALFRAEHVLQALGWMIRVAPGTAASAFRCRRRNRWTWVGITGSAPGGGVAPRDAMASSTAGTELLVPVSIIASSPCILDQVAGGELWTVQSGVDQVAFGGRLPPP